MTGHTDNAPAAFQIRDADPDSAPALQCTRSYFALLLASFPTFSAEDFPLPLPDAARYRPPDGACLIAWGGGQPLGTVSLRRLDATTAELKRLWVDPVARGQRLGLALMQAVEDRARALGYTHAKLDTHSRLPDAIRLYRRNGWVDTAPYTSPHPDTWMIKRL